MSDQQTENLLSLDLDDLLLAEPEIELLSGDDARAIPELGASVQVYFCCTACSCSVYCSAV